MKPPVHHSSRTNSNVAKRYQNRYRMSKPDEITMSQLPADPGQRLALEQALRCT